MSEQNQKTRNVPSASLMDRDSKQWHLNGIRASKNCYHLYFYLLSKSAVDWHTEAKPYYYITDRYWKKSEAAAVIHCDPRTITNNLKMLCERGLLIRDDEGKAYRFTDLNYWVPIHWDIIALFMKLGDDMNWVTMLRLYAILGYAERHYCCSFTVNDLIATLGIRESSGPFLRTAIDWFAAQGLIEITKELKYDKRYGTYYRYTLKSIELGTTQTVQELLEVQDGPITSEWRTKILSTAPVET